MTSCGPAVPVRTPAQRASASAASVTALRASKFDDAARQASAAADAYIDLGRMLAEPKDSRSTSRAAA
ncbi:MAG TPA: hypothetical protein VFT22_03745 [Kofleriaceae bacterium]|nr:hypothetical protein [Kofleriaceae bacterium]